MARQFNVVRQRGFSTLTAITLLMLYVPMLVLVLFAFNGTGSMTSLSGLSLQWFRQMAQDDAIVGAAILSLKLAAISSIAATCLAAMAAIAMCRTRKYRGWILKYAIINVPLIVPEVVTAVALLIVVAKIKQITGYAGLGYLILAHTAFCVPFAFLPVSARLAAMDLTLERAAADLYASPWRAFWLVTFPSLWPGILAGLMLAFVSSLDDVVITEFIKTAGQDTLPTYLLGAVRRQPTPELDALSSLFFVFSLALVGVFFLSNRKAK